MLCAVGNPLTSDDDVRFAVRLDPSKVVATAEKLNLTLRVNTYVVAVICGPYSVLSVSATDLYIEI